MAHTLPRRLRRANRRFTLFADDSGPPRIRPSPDGERHSFAFGGFVVRNIDIEDAMDKWRNVREEFFGTSPSEVKAADFVAENSPFPNLSGDTDRRAVVQGVVAFVLDTLHLIPVACIVDKSNAPDIFTTKTRKGDDTLDKIWAFETVAMGFGVFLEKHRARGQMICDEPGQGRPEHWIERLGELQAAEPAIARIESVTFRPSQESEGIQLADIVTGVLRFVHERREIVRDGLSKVLRHARSEGLGVLLPRQM